MPCPYFLPLRLLGPDGISPAPRLPLIDAWAGECHAGEPFEPPESELRSYCNSGYAGGECSHFPDNAVADAVRFTWVAGSPRLVYIFEKHHAPVEFGEIELGKIEVGKSELGETESDTDLRPILTAQANAFQRSHAGVPGKTPTRPVKAVVPSDLAD